MGFFDALWNYMGVSSPYLLFGFFIAALVKMFLPIKKVQQLLGEKTFGSIFKAAIIGVPLPLCSCSVIPTAVTIKKAGANNGATSAFLISTPESGIDSISMTYGIMDLPMTIIRPIAAFLSAFVAGIGQYMFNDFDYIDDGKKVKPCCSSHGHGHSHAHKEEKSGCSSKSSHSHSHGETSCCGSHGEKKAKKRSFMARLFGYAYGDLIEDVAFWMTLGLILGALIDFLVPENFFVMANGHVGRLIILGVGIPFYICASASTPIAASMVLKGLSPGAALLFLLVGPATNATNIMVLQKYIGKKGIIINIIAISAVALILSYAVDFLYSYFGWPIDYKVSQHDGHNGHLSIVEHISAVIFSVILLRALFITEVLPRFKKKA